ncbi:MAG: COX15/CtaA family protein [Myxococcales bacterium]|nr:COX15/CtaA family protein [Myxococcales bacterium]MDH5566884.1 COX15/CtaA family protein [Myxococcales bacterium]
MSESGIVEEGRAVRDVGWKTSRGVRADHLAAGFAALVACTLVLIVLGALVRAHEAGLACPDWPLCLGEIVPRINFQVAFEWSHRLLAASVALVFAGLAGVALYSTGTPRGVRGLLALAAGLLAAQIVLGALTVWQQLAAWTVTGHLVTGNAFAVTLVLIACTLRDRAPAGAPARAVGTPASLWIAASALLLLGQIVLGGLVSSRFAGLACPEWPTCSGGIWFPSWKGTVGLHLMHRTNAYLLLGSLAASAALSWRTRPLRPWTLLACALGFAQLAVGVANVRLGIPVDVTGLHTGLATLLALTLARAARETLARGVVTPQQAMLHPR